MKRIIGVIVSVAFSFVIVMDNPTILMASLNGNDEENMVTIVAENDNGDVEIKTNFDLDESSDYTEMVISENINNDTGCMDSDFEEVLNSAGLLDSDIERFSDDEIEDIENANEISIVTKFYEIDELEPECIELSPEEVEEYYEEYYKENYDNEAESGDDSVYENESQGIMDKFMNAIGLAPETVYANTYYNKETKKTDGGKFRHTVILCDVPSINGRKSATFNYIVEWLKTPKYCFDDYFTLFLTGSVIKPGNKSYPLSYTIDYKEDIYTYTVETNERKRVNSNKNNQLTFDEGKFSYCCADNKTYMAYHQDLPGDFDGIALGELISYHPQMYYEYHYHDIIMKMSGYVCMTDKNKDQFDINARYFHLNVNKPKVKIESIGLTVPAAITITFSNGGNEKYYSELTTGVNAKIDVNVFK